MGNELFKQINHCLDKWAKVISKEKRGKYIVVKTLNYKGTFYISRMDDNWVSVRCDTSNGYGTYYQFHLIRREEDNHIVIKLYDYGYTDAFGAMGDKYYQAALEKLIECVEHFAATVPQPNELMYHLLDYRYKLHPFVPMPFFDKPGVKAFVFSGHSLVIYAASLEDKLVLSVVTDEKELIDLYSVKRKDNTLLEIERLNHKETLLPDKVVLAVNKFVTKLNSHQPQELY